MPKALRGKKTGFFHVEQLDGKYWLINPKGALFFAVGLNRVYYHSSKDKFGRDWYHEQVSQKFPTESLWAKHISKRLKGWGFNSLGFRAENYKLFPGMSFHGWCSASHPFAALPGKKLLTSPGVPGWMTYVDIFDPDFALQYQKQCAKLAAPHKRIKELVGYFTDNELFWGYGMYPGHSLLDATLYQDASTYNKRELCRFLKERYHLDLRAFNAAWKLKLKSWGQLLGVKELPHFSPRILEDKRAFLYHYARHYFKTTATLLKKADPNHLNLGCRIHGVCEPEVARAMGEYVDVISYNKYDEQAPLYQMEEMLYREAKRPILLSEWGFRAMDAGLPNTGGVGRIVKDQKIRGKKYAEFLKGLASSPYCVGSVFYAYVDDPPTGGGGMMANENSNYGLVSVKDEPYRACVSQVARANAQVHAHKLAPSQAAGFITIATPKDFFREPVERFIVQNNGFVTDQRFVRAYLRASSAGLDSQAAVFQLDFDGPKRFTAWVYEVEQDARLEFLLDGKKKREQRLPAGPGKGQFCLKMPEGWQSFYDKEYGIFVPAGKHTLRVRNSGKGWIWLNAYRIYPKPA